MLNLIHAPYRKNQGQTAMQGSDIPSGSVPALPASPILPSSDLPPSCPDPGGARHRRQPRVARPWTRPGPFHPRTPDLHGKPCGPHRKKPLYPNLGALREQGPAAAGPPQRNPGARPGGTRPPHICKGGHGPLPGPAQGSSGFPASTHRQKAPDWSLTGVQTPRGGKGWPHLPAPETFHLCC